jgi:hypothetical protein
MHVCIRLRPFKKNPKVMAKSFAASRRLFLGPVLVRAALDQLARDGRFEHRKRDPTFALDRNSSERPPSTPFARDLDAQMLNLGPFLTKELPKLQPSHRFNAALMRRVQIQGCGRNTRVTQHFLNGAEVGAAAKEIRRAAVSERMRADALFDSGERREALDPIAHGARREVASDAWAVLAERPEKRRLRSRFPAVLALHIRSDEIDGSTIGDWNDPNDSLPAPLLQRSNGKAQGPIHLNHIANLEGDDLAPPKAQP